MIYLRGIFLLFTFLWNLFPMVLELVKFVSLEKDRALRKQLAKDLIDAQKKAVTTGDTKDLEVLLKSE